MFISICVNEKENIIIPKDINKIDNNIAPAIINALLAFSINFPP